MSSVVYVVHEPIRWNSRDRCMVPLDLTPAKQYGQLKLVLPGGNRPPPLTQAMPQLKETMAEFTDQDYLLLAGDMDLLVWAAALALRATGGRVKLLKFDNRTRLYEVRSTPEDLFT
jgi:hypothetical protein